MDRGGEALLGGGGGGNAGHGGAHDDAHTVGRGGQAPSKRLGRGGQRVLGKGVGVPQQLARQPQVHIGHLGRDPHRQVRRVEPRNGSHGAGPGQQALP